MAKFRVYNIQLLPVDGETKEVGVSGYRRLFSKFQSYNKSILREHREGTYHYRQTEDMFIGPNDFSFGRGYVYGTFIRYRKTDLVTELGTGRHLYTAGVRTGITGEERLAFVFDTNVHLFAIETPSSMPSSQAFGDALQRMLQPIADENFPKHDLGIHSVSRPSELQKVFQSANTYSVVDLDLSFRNGHDTEELLQELKETRTKNLTVKASAGKGGRMTHLPEFLKNMLVAATSGLGSARISYYVNRKVGNRLVERQEIYDSRDMPVSFQVNRTEAATKDPDGFFDRIRHKLLKIEDDLEEEVEGN
ncbi:hypothetical protein [Pandoraea sputorum]|uniref:hypothetical protein n=1 Tax=Pandoraea sputorum TaxID=93222 RepID=UPI00123EF5AD|nr:hypothetical protein [Pandoraea sputorum]VVE78160.1 hypothetical protein PSP31120_01537 [Pandoraea sputorum]